MIGTGMKDIKECQKILADELKRVEDQIYEAESKYLEETTAYGNIIRGWDGYLNKPNKPQAALTQKKPRLYACERIFSGSSLTSPLRKEEAAQDHPILKRKSQNIIAKVAKDLDKMKVNKKSTSKHKKLKIKSKRKAPFESSSDVLGMSVSGMKDAADNSASIDPLQGVGSEVGADAME